MELGRIAQSMLPVALVLTALTNFNSAPLAGALTFLSITPGLLAAPFVGALIDRFGKLFFIRLDYVVGAAVTAIIAMLPVAAPETVPVLLGLTLALGATQLFSDAGFRSLFASIVPSHLWERVNAVDSSGYQVASIAGPPLAAALFAFAGQAAVFAVIAIAYTISTLFSIGIHDPRIAVPGPAQHLVRSALGGLAYVARNPSLRGMAVSVSMTGVALGIATILVPVLVIDQLGADEALVGIAFGLAGVVGVAAAVVIGRLDMRNRERTMIVAAHIVITTSVVLLLPVAQAGLVAGLAWVMVAMVARGAGESAWDLGVFTLRQRATDPSMFGRAFAISMALNYSGVPIGAALGGWLAATDVTIAIVVAIAFGCLGSICARVLIPRITTQPA